VVGGGGGGGGGLGGWLLVWGGGVVVWGAGARERSGEMPSSDCCASSTCSSCCVGLKGMWESRVWMGGGGRRPPRGWGGLLEVDEVSESQLNLEVTVSFTARGFDGRPTRARPRPRSRMGASGGGGKYGAAVGALFHGFCVDFGTPPMAPARP
jgi:hypothetical protein